MVIKCILHNLLSERSGNGSRKRFHEKPHTKNSDNNNPLNAQLLGGDALANYRMEIIDEERNSPNPKAERTDDQEPV